MSLNGFVQLKVLSYRPQIPFWGNGHRFNWLIDLLLSYRRVSWVAFFFLYPATLSGRLNEVCPYFRLTLYLVYCLKIQRSSGEDGLNSSTVWSSVVTLTPLIWRRERWAGEVACSKPAAECFVVTPWWRRACHLRSLHISGRTSETPSKLQEAHSLYHRLPQNPKKCQRTCWSLPD